MDDASGRLRPASRSLGRSLGRAITVLCGASLLAGAAVAEEAGWSTVREVEGITLARRDQGGGGPAVRATTVIDAELPRVLAVIRDVPRHTEWRSRLLESRVLEEQSDYVTILYNRIEGYWPVSDRDVVLRSQTVVEGPDSVRIEVDAAESPKAPDPDGAVRMPRLDALYALRSLGPQRTEVEYQMTADLGGYVPGWIVRFASEDMPLETLQGLRRQVERLGDSYGRFAGAWRAAASRGEIPSLR